MHRGYTKSYRKELDSDIWKLPPLFHRTWFWIRSRCNHETACIPTTRGYGIWLLPGQRLTSIQQIAEGVAWYENGQQKTPDKRTIVRVLDWLEAQQCITVTSNAHGSLVSVMNWHTYNSESPLQVTDDVPPVQRTMYTEKNDKEEKNLKDSCASPPAKRPSRIPSGDHQTFIAWWCFAYEITQGKPYLTTGKDMKPVKELLATYTLKPLVFMACWFLTCRDEWLGSKRDIAMFRSQANRIPGPKDPAHDSAAYRRAGIIPPEGVMFENWRFWEQNEPQEALAL